MQNRSQICVSFYRRRDQMKHIVRILFCEWGVRCCVLATNIGSTFWKFEKIVRATGARKAWAVDHISICHLAATDLLLKAMAIRYSWDLIMGVRSKAGDLVGGVSINFQLHILDPTPSPRIPAMSGNPNNQKPVRFPKAYLKGLRELVSCQPIQQRKKAHILRSFRAFFVNPGIFFLGDFWNGWCQLGLFCQPFVLKSRGRNLVEKQ